ncbi:MAG: hypothetical protein CEN89_515 [Candidatus Berkelbacteria bacterium Licking1014_7]|uniref:Uncharacterized protein n=1 Tax=Candidatus Berkelbacteria bacterium Licking1014_7 TaxID=2017147 RepID=A0A554LJB4_9BACT|nr:MAG: hypothetical protein CEN89_515 [Candidatus Berkelbacteria bacterium Licking1014_7]
MHTTAESAEQAQVHYVDRQPNDFLCETCLAELPDMRIASLAESFSAIGLLDAHPRCVNCGHPLTPTHHLIVAVV